MILTGPYPLLSLPSQGYLWIVTVGFTLLMVILSPWSRTLDQFFRARTRKGAPGVWMLTSSLVISWIFAKSITNAANMGMAYGLVGGLGYAGYYFSFLIAGWVIYQLRTRGHFDSLHGFIRTRYGHWAVLLFSLLVGFRLFNEVWSNTMVIGTYFGNKGSAPYFLSIALFTLLTLLYSLKGGLRSSLMTDAFQTVFFGISLFLILSFVIPLATESGGQLMDTGAWRFSGGLDFLFLALVQAFSYPFHDPVMTDRGFISDARTTLKGFLWAGLIGGVAIFLFSFVGLYASTLSGTSDQAVVLVTDSLGFGMMLLMNLIMVLSAGSTLDSAFFSFAKLSSVDHGSMDRKASVFRARVMMVVIALGGTVPLFLDPAIIEATTISGTMVIGLAPVFLLWKVKAPSLSYFLSTGTGVVLGILYVSGVFPQGWTFWDTEYGPLLTVNLIGTVLCFGGYLIPVWLSTSSSGA